MPPSPDPKTGSDGDGSSSRVSDAALRKKKNADAQAAFRARRANYIATLEETVTNLESVVLQLQDSCRALDTQLQESRQEASRYRTELDHKESMIRMYEQQQKKVDREPQDDYPISSYPPVRTPPVMASSMSAGPASHYGDDGMRYSSGSTSAPSMNGSSYHNPNGQDYPQRSPAMSYVSVPGTGSSEPRSMDPHSRMPRYDPYAPYPIDTSGRDGNWVSHPGTAVSDPGSMDNGSATHSPTFVESPTLTASDLSYSSRYNIVDDQKVPLTPSYMFAPSRSLSPAASTPSSTSSTSLAPASYPFTFPEGTALQERPEFYRRQPELTLHGGTADISSIVRMSGRTAPPSSSSASASGLSPSADRPSLVQAPSPYSRADNGSHERESDGESSSYTYSSRARTRPASVSRGSRSPSPGPAPICGTLAVIKAQAFGALRRTRGRSKKTTEGAAKAAVEALAARGIGVVGNPAKRPRLHDSDGDLRI
ncbi:hypothetical protein VTO73DRAFT_1103 [Trametes versicolor]